MPSLFSDHSYSLYSALQLTDQCYINMQGRLSLIYVHIIGQSCPVGWSSSSFGTIWISLEKWSWSSFVTQLLCSLCYSIGLPRSRVELVVYKPALRRVDLLRLTLLTMPDFGTNHKKRGRRHFWPNCQILKHWLRNWRGVTYYESVQRKWIKKVGWILRYTCND